MQPSTQDESTSQASADTTDSVNAAAAAPKTKTGAGKVIAAIAGEPAKIFAFIGKEAGVIAKLFAAEEPAVQADLKAASQAVQVIKTNLTENPVVVSYLLRQINPAWTEDSLNALLSKAASALNITQTIVQPTLADTITNLQSHASQLTDEVSHNSLWTGLFNALGILISPGTPWNKVVTFGVYIYNTFIKKA